MKVIDPAGSHAWCTILAGMKLNELGPPIPFGWPPRKSIANIMAKIVDSEIMQIHYREPVLVIGREPLVAGTIVLRNYLRARKRYEKQLRWNSLTSRLRLFGRTSAKK